MVGRSGCPRIFAPTISVFKPTGGEQTEREGHAHGITLRDPSSREEIDSLGLVKSFRECDVWETSCIFAGLVLLVSYMGSVLDFVVYSVTSHQKWHEVWG